jgi:carboxynorspermidine decarboxylase
MPETFEYQFLPDVFGDVETGEFGYILAGSTCLAGDIFGEYSFMERLEVGSRVVFTDVGAYTLVKAHTFNGLNLPSVYALTAQGDLILKKRFTFEEYALRWGMQPHVSV